MGAVAGPPGTVDACAVLGSAASRLSAGHTVGEVLADVVRHVGFRSAVLRTAGGDLLAVAGDVVHAVPTDRTESGPVPVVELPLSTGLTPFATLTVVGARVGDLPLLRALVAVLSLNLARPVPDRLPLALLEAADDDSSAVADALHDGPVQDLLAARLAADAAVRSGDLGSVRDAVQTALQSLRRALWFLRPRGVDDGGLGGALGQLSARLEEAGRPPLALDLQPLDAAALSSHAASVGYRLVQSAAAQPGEPSTRVRLCRTADGVQLTVGTDRPLTAPAVWAARAQAVGGSLTVRADRAVLTIPADPGDRPSAPPTPTTSARRST